MGDTDGYSCGRMIVSAGTSGSSQDLPKTKDNKTERVAFEVSPLRYRAVNYMYSVQLHYGKVHTWSPG